VPENSDFAADVLVVGAGPTGLEMASEARRHGLSVKIIDNNAQASDKSKALGVHARSLEIFDAMGIVDKFTEEGVHMHSVQVHSGGKVIIKLSLDELDSPYNFTVCIPQSKTEQFLSEHLETFGTQVERSVELVGLEQDNAGVTAKVKHADGSEHEVRARWLIGCDGAHSATRHLLDMKFVGSQYPEVFALADVRIDGTLSEDAIHLFVSELGLLAFFPMGDHHFRIAADLGPRENIPKEHGPNVHCTLPAPTLAEFQQMVDERTGQSYTLSDPVWLAEFGLHCRQVDRYREGRVFIAGDAAHIHSPAGGQGMNTGIQDAYNLAWKLALVTKGVAKESLLESYNAERHAVGQSVLKMTDFMTKVNTMRNPIAQKLRNFLAPALASQELVQQRMRNDVSELAISYRKSPIVAQNLAKLVHASTSGHARPDEPHVGDWFAFERGPHAGDRAPDCHLERQETQEPMRLHELLRSTEHQLLLFAGARTAQSILRTLVEIGNFVLDKYGEYIKPHIICGVAPAHNETAWKHAFLIDADLATHHKYGAGSECLYLLRPDGYIAFRSQPADKIALNEYLESIFV
jgi:2-polyprenyl-6-methoxyphenol hydroxylase-like FAD-dependent oxidoreductase